MGRRTGSGKGKAGGRYPPGPPSIFVWFAVAPVGKRRSLKLEKIDEGSGENTFSPAFLHP
jgi:hypothetical protein